MATRHVTYQLASTASYRFNITKIGEHNYDELAYFYKSDFPDVEVTRPATGTDLLKVHESCLITVNGFVHATAYAQKKLFVLNATKGMLRSRSNVVGIIDFSDITPKLKKLSMTPQMVSEDVNTLAYDRVLITFEESVEQPVLVLAGYLVFYDPECFYRISDNSFALCLSKMQYMEKLYELNRCRDIFKDLDVPVSPLNPEMVDANVVRSLATIKKLLTLENSFIVDLQVDNLSLKKIYLEHSKIPGTFATEKSPVYPLIVGYGKVAEYAVRMNNDIKYSVYTQDAHYNNYLLSHMKAQTCRVYNDNRLPGKTHGLTQAFFIDITAER